MQPELCLTIKRKYASYEQEHCVIAQPHYISKLFLLNSGYLSNSFSLTVLLQNILLLSKRKKKKNPKTEGKHLTDSSIMGLIFSSLFLRLANCST